MTNAKKILITTESHEIFVVRDAHGERIYRNCPVCGRDTDFAPIDDAVNVTEIPTLEPLRQIDLGVIHVRETSSGHLLACQKSVHEVLLTQITR